MLFFFFLILNGKSNKNTRKKFEKFNDTKWKITWHLNWLKTYKIIFLWFWTFYTEQSEKETPVFYPISTIFEFCKTRHIERMIINFNKKKIPTYLMKFYDFLLRNIQREPTIDWIEKDINSICNDITWEKITWLSETEDRSHHGYETCERKLVSILFCCIKAVYAFFFLFYVIHIRLN